MPSSYTASARFTKQATGENNNTWGNILNSGVFELVDTNINGYLGFALSSSKTLTTALGASDEARNAILDVTSGSGGTIIIPPVSKAYWLRNASGGLVTVTAGGAANALMGSGDNMPIWTDGSNVYPIKIAGYAIKDYIDQAILATTGSLPAATGNNGKALVVQAGAWVPTYLTTSLLTDYSTNVKGLAVAMAVAL